MVTKTHTNGSAAVLETYTPVSDGANDEIAFSEPYTARVVIQGNSPLLCHAWNAESIDEKARGPKGSKVKKTDDVESYVYRNEDGQICLAAMQLRSAIIGAAKFQQDPRSPRKSAMDLFKAGVVVTPELASLGSKNWDYISRLRCRVQMSAITRERPAFRVGWKAEFQVTVILAEYIGQALLHRTIADAGRLCGVGDFRPTYGRFDIVRFEIGN